MYEALFGIVALFFVNSIAIVGLIILAIFIAKIIVDQVSLIISKKRKEADGLKISKEENKEANLPDKEEFERETQDMNEESPENKQKLEKDPTTREKNDKATESGLKQTVKSDSPVFTSEENINSERL